ncbi:MAG: hypothetical protein L6Q93_14355, partial [Phycisphaerae bacterium]|nr:hypothetical protein [Phycisphaerae bacterium]
MIGIRQAETHEWGNKRAVASSARQQRLSGIVKTNRPTPDSGAGRIIFASRIAQFRTGIRTTLSVLFRSVSVSSNSSLEPDSKTRRTGGRRVDALPATKTSQRYVRLPATLAVARRSVAADQISADLAGRAV